MDDRKKLTKTWIQRELHQQPTASFGKSWDAHLLRMGEPSPQPGIGGTAKTEKGRKKTRQQKITQSVPWLHTLKNTDEERDR